MAKATNETETSATMTRPRARGRGLQPRSLRGTRGAVLVEYALLLVGVAVPTVIGLVAGGSIMLQKYQEGRDAILQSYP